MVLFHCPVIFNNETFYTDSNGLNLLHRNLTKNGTNTYTNYYSNKYNGIAENYYPVTTTILINGTDVDSQAVYDRIKARIEEEHKPIPANTDPNANRRLQLTL